jgi:hypothetical protein
VVLGSGVSRVYHRVWEASSGMTASIGLLPLVVRSDTRLLACWAFSRESSIGHALRAWLGRSACSIAV